MSLWLLLARGCRLALSLFVCVPISLFAQSCKFFSVLYPNSIIDKLNTMMTWYCHVNFSNATQMCLILDSTHREWISYIEFICFSETSFSPYAFNEMAELKVVNLCCVITSLHHWIKLNYFFFCFFVLKLNASNVGITYSRESTFFLNTSRGNNITKTIF